jgi:hypothetical protein
MNQSPASWQVLVEDNFKPVVTDDGSVHAAERIFEARSSSRQCKLLKSLAERKSGILLREELLTAVYEDLFCEQPQLALGRTTVRYRSAVKTISRARIALESFFSDLAPPGFNWLPWNEKLGGWILFQRAQIDQSMAI